MLAAWIAGFPFDMFPLYRQLCAVHRAVQTAARRASPLDSITNGSYNMTRCHMTACHIIFGGARHRRQIPFTGSLPRRGSGSSPPFLTNCPSGAGHGAVHQPHRAGSRHLPRELLPIFPRPGRPDPVPARLRAQPHCGLYRDHRARLPWADPFELLRPDITLDPGTRRYPRQSRLLREPAGAFERQRLSDTLCSPRHQPAENGRVV